MLQALEWEDAYSSPTPPGGEHPMPLTSLEKERDGKASGGGGDKKGGGSKGSKSRSAGEKAEVAAAENGSTASGSASGSGGAGSQYENPSKHLVYRPTSMQLLSILTTTMEVLPREGVLLLYLSANSGRPGAELKTGGAFASTSNLMSAEIAPHDADSVQPDNMSDVSGLSVGALTVANSSAEAGLNLGPSKAQVGTRVGGFVSGVEGWGWGQ